MARIRDTKYPDRAAVYAAIQWAGDRDWIDAYQAGRMLPEDMPDAATAAVAELIQMYMTLAERHFTELLKLITPEEEDNE